MQKQPWGNVRAIMEATRAPTVAVTSVNGDASLLTTVVQPFRQPHELRPY